MTLRNLPLFVVLNINLNSLTNGLSIGQLLVKWTHTTKIVLKMLVKQFKQKANTFLEKKYISIYLFFTLKIKTHFTRKMYKMLYLVFLGEIISEIINKKNKNRKIRKTQKYFILNVCCVLVFCVFCAVLCVGFCTGHSVMVPLNLTCLHCLQYSFFEHLFNLYYINQAE